MLKKLTKLTDVQVGDYVPTKLPMSDYHGIAMVQVVDKDRKSFMYVSGTSFNHILESEIKDIVLLRKTQQSLDILAGEKAYKKLTTKDSKTKAHERLTNHETNAYLPGEGYRDEHGIIR